jgi:hypothetical protein
MDQGPTAIHRASGHKFHPSEKANAIAGCLEIQFTPHDLCDDNHERRVEARVQAILETVDNNPPQRIRPCDLMTLMNTLNSGMHVELMAFLMNASGIFQGSPDSLILSLPSAVSFFKFLEESKSSQFT